MSYWLVASIAYTIALGAIGVTIKVSLNYVTWHVIILATTIAYLFVCGVFLARGMIHLPTVSKDWVAPLLLTGLLASGSFVLLSTALKHGSPSRVIPITAAYPLVGVLLAWAFLGESIQRAQWAGTLLIAIGAFLVAR